jgi:hypothetical protein
MFLQKKKCICGETLTVKPAAVALSGDVAITNAGVVTIETDAVTTAKILDGTILAADIATADAVTTAKIDGNELAADIANAAVTNAKLDGSNIPLSGFAAAAANVDLGTSFKLINVLDPTLAQDAATKKLCRYSLNPRILNKNVFVGDINGEAAAVALSGDAAITNAGVVTIETDAVTTQRF